MLARLYPLLALFGFSNGQQCRLSNTGIIRGTIGTFEIMELSISGRTLAFHEEEGNKIRIYRQGIQDVVFGDGEDVALAGNGDLAVVAFHDEARSTSTCEPNMCAEVVRVMARKDGEWQQLGSDIEVETSDGHVVTANGAGVFLAVRTEDGLAKVYLMNTANIWVQLGNNLPSQSSLSLAKAGLRIATADRLFNSGGQDLRGRVEIYGWSNATSSWVFETRYDGSAAGERFGRSFAMNDKGTLLAVGSLKAGKVRVYARNFIGSWSRQPNIEPDSATPIEDAFGYSVAMSSDGRTIVAGAYKHDSNGLMNNGRAYVFQQPAGSDRWEQVATLDGTGDEDNLGWSVAVDETGSWLAAGTRTTTSYVRYADIDCKGDVPTRAPTKPPPTLEAPTTSPPTRPPPTRVEEPTVDVPKPPSPSDEDRLDLPTAIAPPLAPTATNPLQEAPSESSDSAYVLSVAIAASACTALLLIVCVAAAVFCRRRSMESKSTRHTGETHGEFTPGHGEGQQAVVAPMVLPSHKDQVRSVHHGPHAGEEILIADAVPVDPATLLRV